MSTNLSGRLISVDKPRGRINLARCEMCGPAAKDAAYSSLFTPNERELSAESALPLVRRSRAPWCALEMKLG